MRMKLPISNVITSDKIISVCVAVKMLPTSILSIEILKPAPFFTIMRPIANEIDETNPIAASPLMVLDVDRYFINTEANITKGIAIKSGSPERITPKIIPAKLTCAKPSAIIAC